MGDEEHNNTQVQWNGESFKEMKNLSVLIITDTTFSTYPSHLPNSLRVLHWSRYPSSSLPCNFNPKRLEILCMPQSCFQIFQADKKFQSLSKINFGNCMSLTHVLSLREVPLLTDLCLDRCSNLVKIDDSIGFLDKLRTLSAKGCIKLKSLAPCIMLPSLEILDLRECSCLESFPEVVGKMEKIREIHLENTAIEALPYSIGNLVGLELLSLWNCRRLSQLPPTIYVLPKVEVEFVYSKRYRFFEGKQEEVSAKQEVSAKAMLAMCYGSFSHYYSDFTAMPAMGDGSFPNNNPELKRLDVYYPHTSPNNVIQVCAPNPLMHSDFDLLLGKVEIKCSKIWVKSMQLRFQNKFPKIVLCFSTKNGYGYDYPRVLTLKFTVLINGTKQFSCSCDYISSGRRQEKFWCDIECKAEEIFSKHKWNKLEILRELDFPGKCWYLGGHLDWTLMGVYEKGGSNMEDIEFINPMSTFGYWSETQRTRIIIQRFECHFCTLFSQYYCGSKMRLW